MYVCVCVLHIFIVLVSDFVDPLHLEMTVMDLEYRLKKVEDTQQQILQRLDSLCLGSLSCM